MTDLGSSTSGSPESGESEGAEKITIKDNRRIDRSTGAVRNPPPPGSAAANPGDPDNAGQPIAAQVLDGSEELEAARSEAAERTADLQRLSAEYANYRKRVERDKQAARESGKAAVIAELLAVCDDLDRAEEHGDLVGGFKNVADKFTGILDRLGLAHFGAEGDEFDPVFHEAVQFATSAEVDRPTVTTVLRRGYLFEEKVLRPAVVVVTGPEDESTDAAGDNAAADTTVDSGPVDDAAGGDAGAVPDDAQPDDGADAE